MTQDQWHFPDFTAPDFAQPVLSGTEQDLTTPDFVLLDPARSTLWQLPLWPEDLSSLASGTPDPALPDLLAMEQPDALSYPAGDAHVLPGPENAPQVVMQQRPGELDPAARNIVLRSPDEATLPPGLSYSQLYTSDEQMSWRKRHFAMQEPGLEASGDDRYAD